MDMIDKIEEYLIQEDISNYIAKLQEEYKYEFICESIVIVMQSKLDQFLDTLSKDFIYNYDVYTDGYTIKFKFNMQRRYLYGFLG